MGKQSIFDKAREWLGGIAFDIFLWSARMTQDEYLDAVVRESGLTQRAVDIACTCAAIEGITHTKVLNPDCPLHGSQYH